MTRIVCIGGAVLDRAYRLDAPARAGTSNPARASLAFGGVARNVAESLARLGDAVALVSLVGDDESGAALLAHAKTAGIDVSGTARVPDARTAEYVCVLEPDGGLAMGLAAMELFARFDRAFVEANAGALDGAGLVFGECNLSADAVSALIARANAAGARLALDAVSVAKSARLPRDLSGTGILFCARDEAEAIVGSAHEPEALARALVERGAAAAVVTLGADGLVLAERGAPPRRLPAPPADVVDVTGAGDALIAGTLHRLAAGAPLADALRTGQRLARLAIARPGAVRADLNPALIEEIDHA